MPTLQLSNAATNGFGVGNDTWDGSSKTFVSGSIGPKATLAGAIAAAAASGDTINANSGTPYTQEFTAGNLYPSFTKALTLQTDATALAASGNMRFSAKTGSDRPARFSALCTLTNVDIDYVISSAGCVMAAGSENCVFNNVKHLNNTLGAFYNPGSAVAYNLTWNKCTWSSDDGNLAGSTLTSVVNNQAGLTYPAISTFTFNGCKFKGINAPVAFTATQPTKLVMRAHSDGTWGTVDGLYSGILSPAVGAGNITLDIDSQHFFGTFARFAAVITPRSGAYTVRGSVTRCTWRADGPTGSTSFILSNGGATWSNFVIGGLGRGNCFFGCCGLEAHGDSPNAKAIMIYDPISGLEVSWNMFLLAPGAFLNTFIAPPAADENQNDLKVFNNVGISWNMGHNIPIEVIGGGTGTEVRRNVSHTDGTDYNIYVGSDGPLLAATGMQNNTVTATGYQALGDVAGRVKIAQFIPYVQSDYNRHYYNTIGVRKVLAPNGGITAAIHQDNSGSPGTKIADCDNPNAIPMSDMQTAVTAEVQFWTWSHYKYAAPGYWLVLTFTGTVDGANYATLARNGAGTACKSSPDGVTWTTIAGVSLLFSTWTTALGVVNAQMTDNVSYMTDTGNGACAFGMGCINGGVAARNIAWGTGAFRFSDCDGNGGTAFLVYDNVGIYTIAQAGGTTNQSCLQLRSNRGVQAYHNTFYNKSTNIGMYRHTSFHSLTVPIGTGYSGIPDLSTVKNNLFVMDGAATNFAIRVGYIGLTGPYTDPASIQDNNDWVWLNGANQYAFTNMGTVNGANTTHASFAAYKAATGLDANSVSVDPGLPSPPVTILDVKPANTSAITGIGADLSSLVAADLFGTKNLTYQRFVGAIRPHPGPLTNNPPTLLS